jgi:hypothetical protein
VNAGNAKDVLPRLTCLGVPARSRSVSLVANSLEPAQAGAEPWDAIDQRIIKRAETSVNAGNAKDALARLTCLSVLGVPARSRSVSLVANSLEPAQAGAEPWDAIDQRFGVGVFGGF